MPTMQKAAGSMFYVFKEGHCHAVMGYNFEVPDLYRQSQRKGARIPFGDTYSGFTSSATAYAKEMSGKGKLKLSEDEIKELHTVALEGTEEFHQMDKVFEKAEDQSAYQKLEKAWNAAYEEKIEAAKPFLELVFGQEFTDLIKKDKKSLLQHYIKTDALRKLIRYGKQQLSNFENLSTEQLTEILKKTFGEKSFESLETLGIKADFYTKTDEFKELSGAVEQAIVKEHEALLDKIEKLHEVYSDPTRVIKTVYTDNENDKKITQTTIFHVILPSNFNYEEGFKTALNNTIETGKARSADWFEKKFVKLIRLDENFFSHIFGMPKEAYNANLPFIKMNGEKVMMYNNKNLDPSTGYMKIDHSENKEYTVPKETGVRKHMTRFFQMVFSSFKEMGYNFIAKNNSSEYKFTAEALKTFEYTDKSIFEYNGKVVKREFASIHLENERYIRETTPPQSKYLKDSKVVSALILETITTDEGVNYRLIVAGKWSDPKESSAEESSAETLRKFVEKELGKNEELVEEEGYDRLYIISHEVPALWTKVADEIENLKKEVKAKAEAENTEDKAEVKNPTGKEEQKANFNSRLFKQHDMVEDNKTEETSPLIKDKKEGAEDETESLFSKVFCCNN